MPEAVSAESWPVRTYTPCTRRPLHSRGRSCVLKPCGAQSNIFRHHDIRALGSRDERPSLQQQPKQCAFCSKAVNGQGKGSSCLFHRLVPCECHLTYGRYSSGLASTYSMDTCLRGHSSREPGRPCSHTDHSPAACCRDPICLPSPQKCFFRRNPAIRSRGCPVIETLAAVSFAGRNILQLRDPPLAFLRPLPVPNDPTPPAAPHFVSCALSSIPYIPAEFTSSIRPLSRLFFRSLFQPHLDLNPRLPC